MRARIALLVVPLVALCVSACGNGAPLVPEYAASDLDRSVVAALDVAAQAVEDDPTDAALGSLALLLAAHGMEAESEPVYLAAADAANDDRTRSEWLHLAGCAATQFDLVRAAEHFESAAALRPDYAATHLRLGDAYLELGRFQRAREAFARATELDDDVDARIGRARVELAEGNPAAALSLLEPVAADFPAYGDVHAELSRAYSMLGRLDDARRAAAFAGARQATTIVDPVADRVMHSVVSYQKRLQFALALARAGDIEQAFELIDSAVADDPERAGALLLGATLRSQIGRHEEALTWFDRVLAVDAEHAEAHARRGATLATLGRADEAAAAFERAMEYGPESLVVGEFNARFVAQTDPAAALVQMRDVVVRHPTSPAARMLLAKLLANAGEMEAARTQARAALRLDRFDPDAQVLYRLLMENSGEADAPR